MTDWARKNLTEGKIEELERECYELEKYNCEYITFYMTGYEKGFSDLVQKNAELTKRIEDYNSAGNTVDKQTYNEVVNELAVLKQGMVSQLQVALDKEIVEENEALKLKLQKVNDFVNSCKRSSVAVMIQAILAE